MVTLTWVMTAPVGIPVMLIGEDILHALIQVNGGVCVWLKLATTGVPKPPAVVIFNAMGVPKHILTGGAGDMDGAGGCVTVKVAAFELVEGVQVPTITQRY